MLLKDTCPTAAAILNGEMDADLDYIAQAIKARVKTQFRRGQKVTLTGTKNPSLEGKAATIIKVNVKTVTVGVGEPMEDWGMTIYSEGEFNVPTRMLKAAA
jgi:hypothetical protein